MQFVQSQKLKANLGGPVVMETPNHQNKTANEDKNQLNKNMSVKKGVFPVSLHQHDQHLHIKTIHTTSSV